MAVIIQQLCVYCEERLRCTYEPAVGYTCHLCTVIRELQETLRLARGKNLCIDSQLVEMNAIVSVTRARMDALDFHNLMRSVGNARSSDAPEVPTESSTENARSSDAPDLPSERSAERVAKRHHSNASQVRKR